MAKCDLLSFDQFRELITITEEKAQEIFTRENNALNRGGHWKTPLPRFLLNRIAKELVETGEHDWISYAVRTSGRPSYKRKELLGDRKSYPIMLDKNTEIDIKQNYAGVSRSSVLEGSYWDCKKIKEQLEIATNSLREISTMLYETPREEAVQALACIEAIENR